MLILEFAPLPAEELPAGSLVAQIRSGRRFRVLGHRVFYYGTIYECQPLAGGPTAFLLRAEVEPVAEDAAL